MQILLVRSRMLGPKLPSYVLMQMVGEGTAWEGSPSPSLEPAPGESQRWVRGAILAGCAQHVGPQPSTSGLLKLSLKGSVIDSPKYISMEKTTTEGKKLFHVKGQYRHEGPV